MFLDFWVSQISALFFSHFFHLKRYEMLKNQNLVYCKLLENRFSDDGVSDSMLI